MAKRKIPTFTPEEMDQIRDIQQRTIDNDEITGATPPPPPSGSSAAVPISPGGLGQRGGKAGGFWYQGGGEVNKEDKDYTDYKNKPPPYGRDESRVYPEQARPGAKFRTENWDYGPPYYQPGWRGGLQTPSGPNPKTYQEGGKVEENESPTKLYENESPPPPRLLENESAPRPKRQPAPTPQDWMSRLGLGGNRNRMPEKEYRRGGKVKGYAAGGDTDPEIDPQTRRPKVLTPLRRPSAGGGPVREIDPGPTDVNLGGGSRMIGRAPTYQGGGAAVPGPVGTARPQPPPYAKRGQTSGMPLGRSEGSFAMGGPPLGRTGMPGAKRGGPR